LIRAIRGPVLLLPNLLRLKDGSKTEGFTTDGTDVTDEDRGSERESSADVLSV
jgi:hypothetical protein